MQTLPKTLPKFIWYYIKLYKWVFLLCLLLNLLFSTASALIPYSFKFIIDGINKNTHDIDNIWSHISFYVYIMLGLTLARYLFHRLSRYITIYNSSRMTGKVKMDLFSYMQNHSYKYFADNLSGSLIDKIKDLTTSTNKVIFRTEVILNLFTGLLTMSIVFFQVKWWYSLYLFIWIFIHLVITVFAIPIWQKRFSILGKARNITTGKVVDSISNNANVKMFSAKNIEYKRLEAQVNQEINRGQKAMFSQQRTMLIQSLLMILMIDLGLLYMLIDNLKNGYITIGDLSFVLLSLAPIGYIVFHMTFELSYLMTDYGMGKQAINTINRPYAVKDKDDSNILTINDASINFKNVCFGYAEGKNIFNNLDITIPSGQKVGIVGHSGAGKSTLSQLLLRYYDVNSGTILIGGQDISNVTQDSLRDVITIVPQDTTLFHRTIMENIKYGKRTATDEEVYEAAIKANAHHFILELSKSYNTMVGERGIKLSVGQRQRIAIARAILKNSPIIIMDEATSALDSETENHIQASMENLIQNKTALVIAHRLSTLKSMDRLLVMNNGIVIEDGTHKDLIEKQGYYYKLWTLQHGGFIGKKKDINNG